jgi:hypothetical protein
MPSRIQPNILLVARSLVTFHACMLVSFSTAFIIAALSNQRQYLLLDTDQGLQSLQSGGIGVGRHFLMTSANSSCKVAGEGQAERGGRDERKEGGMSVIRSGTTVMRVWGVQASEFGRHALWRNSTHQHQK